MICQSLLKLNQIFMNYLWIADLCIFWITVRSAETRQKIAQNQPIESISVTEMTTRVEFWLTENRQVSDQNRQKIS